MFRVIQTCQSIILCKPVIYYHSHDESVLTNISAHLFGPENSLSISWQLQIIEKFIPKILNKCVCKRAGNEANNDNSS